MWETIALVFGTVVLVAVVAWVILGLLIIRTANRAGKDMQDRFDNFNGFGSK